MTRRGLIANLTAASAFGAWLSFRQPALAARPPVPAIVERETFLKPFWSEARKHWPDHKQRNLTGETENAEVRSRIQAFLDAHGVRFPIEVVSVHEPRRVTLLGLHEERASDDRLVLSVVVLIPDIQPNPEFVPVNWELRRA